MLFIYMHIQYTMYIKYIIYTHVYNIHIMYIYILCIYTCETEYRDKDYDIQSRNNLKDQAKQKKKCGQRGIYVCVNLHAKREREKERKYIRKTA